MPAMAHCMLCSGTLGTDAAWIESARVGIWAPNAWFAKTLLVNLIHMKTMVKSFHGVWRQHYQKNTQDLFISVAEFCWFCSMFWTCHRPPWGGHSHPYPVHQRHRSSEAIFSQLLRSPKGPPPNLWYACHPIESSPHQSMANPIMGLRCTKPEPMILVMVSNSKWGLVHWLRWWKSKKTTN